MGTEAPVSNTGSSIGDLHRIDGSHHSGNKMAVGNIRERLALHFDAEASLKTSVTDKAYQVHIVIPYRKQQQEG